jgi:UV DNA damage repair endonuclease
MTYNSTRFGFCCKWIDNPAQVNGLKPLDEARKYTTGTTTVSWLKRQTPDVAREKLWNLMVQNIESTRLLVERVGEFAPSLRMVRLSSDILPCYTHESFADYWRQPDVVSYAEAAFKRVGDIARDRDVRLSFHPGQFTVLASSNPEIVARSIEEFEYHANMARWMGYGASWHDHGFKINVHLSGQGGIETFLQSLGKLSPEARNLITIENDEISNGLNSTLLVANHVALVLDIHHHWVNTGEYISPKDVRVQRVVESWRDVRPTLHYSISREDILVGHDPRAFPDLNTLLGRGYKKQKLRAHSDFYWNSAVNEWALSFGDQFDIQCEAKGKNMARDGLVKQLVA